jgi:regulator of sigma E protease
MGFITTTLAFVFVLGIIIFVHEFGHLVTAKAFGMRVLVFSFGFGKRLFGFQWGDTDCRVSALPLGGYVKLEGEPDDVITPSGEGSPELGAAALASDPDYFTNRPRWQRFLVYLAGPVMNAALTITVLSVFYMVGFAVEASRFDRPIVGAVDPGSPAEKGGMEPGDEIVSIDGTAVPTWEDAQYHILLRPDRALRLHIRRGGEERDLEVRSEATSTEEVGTIGVHPLVRVGEVLPGQPAEGAGLKTDDAILAIDGQPMRSFGEVAQVVGGSGGKTLSFRIWRGGEILDLRIEPRDSGAGPKIGITPKTVLKKFSPPTAVAEGLRSTWEMTRQTFDIVGRLLTRQISPRTMMGPLGIAQASGDAARGGAGPLFFLVAVISLQVGILNLFPLVPLDGGHLAILAVEGTARRDLSPLVKSWVMNAGAIAIFLLIGLVLYSDISKLSFVRRLLE